MQKLWSNTNERLAAFQQKNNIHNSQHGDRSLGSAQYYGSNSGSRSIGGGSGKSSSFRSGEEQPNYQGAAGSIALNRDNPAKQTMFPLDDQQLVKLSFAEGYFYGQENIRKPRFPLLSFIREATAITILVGIIYLMVGGESPFKRAILGKKKFEVDPDQIDASFDTVKGCDESKQELSSVVDFLKSPEKYSRLGGKLPKGVLLIGPPGTGKTLLARAVAGEAGVPFFHASGSEFDEMLVGQGARRVRDLFERAKERAPCVIFIDEIDSVGGKRSNSVLHPYANQTINQLLNEMDGFSQNEGVIVIGATNRADDLDKALLRPGRFDVQVTVPVPDYKGRRELLMFYLEKVRAGLDVDMDTLCRTTIGFTGADIENLVNQGALKSAIDGMDYVTNEALEFARDKILMGPEKRSRIQTRDQNLMTAYHEGGHALVAYYTEMANKLHKVTIVSRGSSLGHTSTLPERDSYTQTREQLAASMDVMLGGRVAEELTYGCDRVTTGCSDDLKRANIIATRMVKDFGMSEKIGMRVVREEESESQIVLSGFSDATSELVESEIRRLLEESKSRVRDLLTKHKNELKLLAEALLKYETLDANEVKLIIEGKDPKARQDRDRRSKLNINKVANPPDRLPLDLLK